MDTISHQLSPNLTQTAEKLSNYTWLLKKALPAECINHFNVANIHNKTIIIVANSPVWTTRLRQFSPLILETMQSHSPENLHHVKIITRHGPEVDIHRPHTIKRHLSSEAARLIEQTASHLNDKNLSIALQKLSRHKTQKESKD